MTNTIETYEWNQFNLDFNLKKMRNDWIKCFFLSPLLFTYSGSH